MCLCNRQTDVGYDSTRGSGVESVGEPMDQALSQGSFRCDERLQLFARYAQLKVGGVIDVLLVQAVSL